MVQAAAKPLTFDDFIALYPEDGGRYELRHGEMVEMRPVGPHEQVIALIRRKLDLEIDRLGLPLFIPQSCLIKPQRGTEGYLPDIIALDKTQVKEDPYWNKSSSLSTGAPVKLVVEVVSTNWQDDYLIKLAEYERLGISEYWIVDYRALGGVRFIGSPKTPTVWIYRLNGGEYQTGQSFVEGDTLQSFGFPELSLSVNQIIDASKE
ncbi:MAG: Uma2 family endonuclease [Phormidesmis sp.]